MIQIYHFQIYEYRRFQLITLFQAGKNLMSRYWFTAKESKINGCVKTKGFYDHASILNFGIEFISIVHLYYGTYLRVMNDQITQ